MALDPNINTREFRKFIEDPDIPTLNRVGVESRPTPGVLQSIIHDPISVAMTYDPVTQDMTQIVYVYDDPAGTTLIYNLSYDAYSNLIGIERA